MSDNVAQLTAQERLALHRAICAGLGVAGAAEAAGLDPEELQRLIGGEETSSLRGLADPNNLTPSEYRRLLDARRGAEETEEGWALRLRYAAVILPMGGGWLPTYEEIREGQEKRAREALAHSRAYQRLEEVEAEAARISLDIGLAYEMKAEEQAELMKKIEANRLSAEAEETEEENAGAVAWLATNLQPLRLAYAQLYGSDEEIKNSLGGVRRTAERHKHRLEKGYRVGSQRISGGRYAVMFEEDLIIKKARRLVEETERLVEHYSRIRDILGE